MKENLLKWFHSSDSFFFLESVAIIRLNHQKKLPDLTWNIELYAKA